MQSYLPIFQFSFSHSYYSDGICKDIDLKPTARTKKTFRNYGLIFKQTAINRFSLFLATSESIPEILMELEEDLSNDENLLSFAIQVKNPSFHCYTDQLPDIRNNERLICEVEVSKFPSCQVNIKKANITNLTEEQQYIFSSPTIMGMLFIHLSNQDSSILTNCKSQQHPISVQIPFNPKKVYWKYILLPRSKNEEEISISDLTSQLEFSEIQWTMPTVGQQFATALSRQQLPLADFYPYHLQLWSDSSQGKRLLLERLAAPNAQLPENYTNDSSKNNYIIIYQYF